MINLLNILIITAYHILISVSIRGLISNLNIFFCIRGILILLYHSSIRQFNYNLDGILISYYIEIVVMIYVRISTTLPQAYCRIAHVVKFVRQ